MATIIEWNSNYPTSVDTIGTNFPVLTDGVHDVRASHLNELAAAEVAIQNRTSVLDFGSQLLWAWNGQDTSQLGSSVDCHSNGGALITNLDTRTVIARVGPVLRWNIQIRNNISSNTGVRIIPFTDLVLPSRFYLHYTLGILQAFSTSEAFGFGVMNSALTFGQLMGRSLATENALTIENGIVVGTATRNYFTDKTSTTNFYSLAEEEWWFRTNTLDSQGPSFNLGTIETADMNAATTPTASAHTRTALSGATPINWDGVTLDTLCIWFKTNNTSFVINDFHIGDLFVLKHPLDRY